MTQNNFLNVKLFNAQVNKFRSGIKYSTDISLNFSSNLIGNSNDETNFPYKLLLIDTQVGRLRLIFLI